MYIFLCCIIACFLNNRNKGDGGKMANTHAVGTIANYEDLIEVASEGDFLGRVV